MTPRAAAASPTASKARSLEIISSTSPAVACPSQQPAATAIHRSLQSRTPRAGALCTSCAPNVPRRRATSGPTTRQLPTAVSSTGCSRRSILRLSIASNSAASLVVFSTSMKIARRDGRSATAATVRGGRADPAFFAFVTGALGFFARRCGAAALGELAAVFTVFLAVPGLVVFTPLFCQAFTSGVK